MITDNTTISGAEFRDFYQNHWPGTDWCHDGALFDFEDERGRWTLADDARVALGDCGCMCWQGTNGRPHKSGTMFPFVDFYRRHAEISTTRTLVVNIPIGQEAPFAAALVAIGGSVVVDVLNSDITEPVLESGFGPR